MSVTLAAAAAVLVAVGTYLVLERTLTRVIIGLSLLSHGANTLLMASGKRGTPPIIGRGPADEFSDPMPEAFALTAIVITFAATAFLLALAYRSWLQTHADEVQDDLEDRFLGATPQDEEVSDEEAENVLIQPLEDLP